VLDKNKQTNKQTSKQTNKKTKTKKQTKQNKQQDGAIVFLFCFVTLYSSPHLNVNNTYSSLKLLVINYLQIVTKHPSQ